jgi:hypothetical protein
MKMGGEARLGLAAAPLKGARTALFNIRLAVVPGLGASLTRFATSTAGRGSETEECHE